MEGLLPADVLLKIFSYCSYTDLVKLQFVCRWWQQVSRDKHLWRDIVYKPDRSNTAKDVTENLKASPELRGLDLRDVSCTNVTKELVVEIVNACPQLEQLSVCWYCVYKKFRFKTKKIKILILVDNEDNSRIDLEDYFEHLHVCFPNVEHLDFSDLTSGARNFRAYVMKKGRSIHTLGFCCKDFPPHECRLTYLFMCPNLKRLILSYMCNDTGDLPSESVEHWKQISSLTLQKSLWFDIYGGLCMLKIFPNVVELELDKCILDSEEALLVIAKECPLLEKLTLCNMLIWDANFKYFSNFKKLTYLCLKNNPKITDACVSDLRGILELRYLDISNCCKITPRCLLILCGFARLQTLKFDLRNCDLPASFCTRHVKNPDLHLMFSNCKDTSVLDRLRSQRLRVSLLKGYTSSHRI